MLSSDGGRYSGGWLGDGRCCRWTCWYWVICCFFLTPTPSLPHSASPLDLLSSAVDLFPFCWTSCFRMSSPHHHRHQRAPSSCIRGGRCTKRYFGGLPSTSPVVPHFLPQSFSRPPPSHGHVLDHHSFPLLRFFSTSFACISPPPRVPISMYPRGEK